MDASDSQLQKGEELASESSILPNADHVSGSTQGGIDELLQLLSNPDVKPSESSNRSSSQPSSTLPPSPDPDPEPLPKMTPSEEVKPSNEVKSEEKASASSSVVSEEELGGSSQSDIEKLLKLTPAEPTSPSVEVKEEVSIPEVIASVEVEPSSPVVEEKKEEAASIPEVSGSVLSDDLASILNQTQEEKAPAEVVPPTSVDTKSETKIETKSGVESSPQNDIEALLKSASIEAVTPTTEVKKEEAASILEVSGSVSSDDLASILNQAQEEKVPAAVVPSMSVDTKIETKSAGESSSQNDIEALLKAASTEAVTPSSEVKKEESKEENKEKKVDPSVSIAEEAVVAATISASHEGQDDQKDHEKSKREVKVETKSLSSLKEFDISTDPEVVAMKERVKAKGHEVLKNFVTYKTFSIAFIRQIPRVISRRRKAKLIFREFFEWMEAEKNKIQAIEDPTKKAQLLKASFIFDQEMLVVRRQGIRWVRQGWSKMILILLWLISFGVALVFGLPSVLRLYFTKPLQKVELHEIAEAEKLGLEAPKKEKESGPQSYLLLSCESSEIGQLGKIRVFDREGKEVATFPPHVNTLKKKILTSVPSGEIGIIIETEELPIVGVMVLAPHQRRYIDLSKWTDPLARSMVRITTTPAEIPIICDGANVGRGEAKISLIAGIHKIWAAIPQFPAQEQQIMIVDDREVEMNVTVNVARMVFKIAEATRKGHPQIKVLVDGSPVANWESYSVLYGYHLVQLVEGGRLIGQHELNLEAGEEVYFEVSSMEGGHLTFALSSKKKAY